MNTKEMLLEKILKKYNVQEKDVLFSTCPYRICPVGAHIDHQLGNVTGFAINYGVTIVFIPSNDNTYEIESLNFDGVKNGVINRTPNKQNDWADYIRGANKLMHEKYGITNGIKGIIYGELPSGGISSSASVVLAYIKALCMVNNIMLTKDEAGLLSKEVENKYVGVNSGILDQSCELYSKENHLLYLDVKTGEKTLYKASNQMPDYEFAIFFSGVKRALVGSKFNTRVDELKSAAYSLMAHSDMDYGSFNDSVLRDVPRKVYEQYKYVLPVNFRKRAKHFYTEMDRVEEMVKAWQNGDIEEVGRISKESCESSINNYECGSPELIKIYELMKETEGIYGGRFSGAGFKGCCVGIINPKYEELIKEEVTRAYLEAFPQYKETFQIYFAKSTDGCNGFEEKEKVKVK